MRKSKDFLGIAVIGAKKYTGYDTMSLFWQIRKYKPQINADLFNKVSARGDRAKWKSLSSRKRTGSK